MSFEIIAIATKKKVKKKGKNTSSFDSIKVLKEDEIFKLNNNYGVTFSNEDSCEIETLRDATKLYSRKKTQIQVNAIVGMNGSGKSTLSEILYLMLYNLSVYKQVIENDQGGAVQELKGELNSCLIFKKDNIVYCIDFNIDNNCNYLEGNKIKVYSSQFEKAPKVKIDFNSSFETDFDLKDLFYTVSLNYSLYGLNELNMGAWIKNVFHKNDMYEAPIVINPYRNEGKINVNTESFQNNARLLSNLSKRGRLGKGATLSGDYFFSELKVIFNENIRKEYKLTLPLKEYIQSQTKKLALAHRREFYLGVNYNPHDFFENSETKSDFEEVSFNSKITIDTNKEEIPLLEYATLLLANSKDSFDTIHEFFHNIKGENDLSEITNNLFIDNVSPLLTDLFSYFIYKLYKIGIIYEKKFNNLLNPAKTGFNSGKDFKDAIFEVLTSESHACFKLKRIFYFLNYTKGYKLLTPIALEKKEKGCIEWALNPFTTEKPSTLMYLKDQKKHVAKSLYDKVDIHFFASDDLIWKIPPAVFELQCQLTKEDGDNVNLDQLSSGETQFIYTLQTALYHLVNIDSNEEYESAVLLFDEIELYYHPEYQRVFLKILLDQIDELKLEKVKNIQIIFLTHSPFILSDIPSSNILKLVEGNPEPSNSESFASNIYDLLKDDFFLENGVIGEFAKDRIEKIIKLNDEKVEDQLDIINLIGDPFLKNIAIEKINSKIRKRALIQRQIEELKLKLKDIDES